MKAPPSFEAIRPGRWHQHYEILVAAILGGFAVAGNKWIGRSKTMWVNGAALVGLVAAGQDPDTFQGVIDMVGGESEAVAAAVVPAGNLVSRLTTTDTLGPDGKSWIKSKTMIWNLLMIAAGVFAFTQENPTMGVVFIGLALVNMVLRGVTGSKVTLFPHRNR